ncbi:unnamed protein product, partial [marine sediment metagenome]
MAAILASANLVMRGGKGLAPTLAADYPHIYNDENAGNIMITTAGGRVASMVAIWPNEVRLGPVALRIGGINCLLTLPEFRRHALGAGVMRAAHEHMRALGCQIGLLRTKITNWYRALGWELAGEESTWHFDSVNIDLLPALPANVALRPAEEDGVDDVIRLRHSDRLGGVREPDTFRRILIARKARIVL